MDWILDEDMEEELLQLLKEEAGPPQVATSAPNNDDDVLSSAALNHEGNLDKEPPSEPEPGVGGTLEDSGDSDGETRRPKLYKTKLCINFQSYGKCSYGTRCQFAHEAAEMRVDREGNSYWIPEAELNGDSCLGELSEFIFCIDT